MNILSDLLDLLHPRIKQVFIALAIVGAFVGATAAGYMQRNGAQAKCGQIECSQIDQAKFYRLDTGMSLAEVEAILGAGTKQSQTPTETTFIWRNAEGYAITAVFTDRKLQRHSQF